jgi:hypothetical protein
MMHKTNRLIFPDAFDRLKLNLNNSVNHNCYHGADLPYLD